MIEDEGQGSQKWRDNWSIWSSDSKDSKARDASLKYNNHKK